QVRWGAFGILQKKTQLQQKQILLNAAYAADQDTGSKLEQKLGELYMAGMDTAAINKLGFEPIKPQIATISNLQTPADIAEFLRTSYNNGQGYIFHFRAGADFEDATQQIAYV